MLSKSKAKNNKYFNVILNEYFSIIVIVILILFLLLAYFVILRPKFIITQNVVKVNLLKEKSLYQDSLEKKNNYEILSKLYKKISPKDLERFNAVLPDSYVPEKLFGELEEMINQGGWLINSLTIAPEKKIASKESSNKLKIKSGIKPLFDPHLGHYQLTLEVGAIDYSGLKNLLKIFENNLRFFDIDSVDFSPSANTVKLVVTTYYYKALP